jgi:hypothetical protein
MGCLSEESLIKPLLVIPAQTRSALQQRKLVIQLLQRLDIKMDPGLRRDDGLVSVA